jgi:hypothetical protein
VKLSPILIPAVIALIACSSCQNKKPTPAVILQQELKKITFVAPSDSIVSADNMKKWLLCNPYLDSLSVIYKDSFATTNAAKQTRYQDDFVKAQDKICVRMGLLGGYEQYLWILKACTNPVNAKVLDSMKLTAYR